MLRSLTDRQLANAYRQARNETRPIFNELSRRGFRVVEKHGHHEVSVDTFENISIRRVREERL